MASTVAPRSSTSTSPVSSDAARVDTPATTATDAIPLSAREQGGHVFTKAISKLQLNETRAICINDLWLQTPESGAAAAYHESTASFSLLLLRRGRREQGRYSYQDRRNNYHGQSSGT